jgi:hypothetical protein
MEGLNTKMDYGCALDLAKSFAGPFATVVAATVAAGIAWSFNSRQLKVADAQGKLLLQS